MKKILAALLILAPLSLIGCKSPDKVASPPLIYLIAGDGTLIDGFQGPYCWESGSGPALCADPVFPPVFAETPTLPAGEPFHLLLDTPLPDYVNLSLSKELFGDALAADPVVVAENVDWSPQVEPGQYILAVDASWKQGQVSYWFSIKIE